MGQPRASRRKAVVLSSDEDDAVNDTIISETGIENEDQLTQKSKPGQLKRIDRSKKSSDSTAKRTNTTSPHNSPPKKRATKSKSNTAPEQQTKAKAKPIYSFFNSATQKQQISQPTPSPEKARTTSEQAEAIQDDSDDDAVSHVSLSKGSSTATAMRKRKFQTSQGREEETPAAPSATQKFRKTGDSARVPSLSINNEDKRPWTEQFAPTDLVELAVHKRKVADVRQWLDTTLAGRRQKVLVLKGQAGTGKTATIKLLAENMGCEILEWRNPGGTDAAADGALSAAAQFEDFIGRAGKATGLTLMTTGADQPSQSAQKTLPTPSDIEKPQRKRQILLVEEFPNTFSRTSTILQSFRSALLQHASSVTTGSGVSTPIVLVISETLLSTNTAAADSFTAHRLLGPELIIHPYINTIEFNPVAPTFLTKALETIVLKEARKSGRRKTPGPLVLKHIAESGDLRSAVSTLEFLCLRGDGDDIWSSKVNFSKTKKVKSDTPLTNSEQEALKLISNRESTLGIFHAVGKVVYNKRVEPLSDALAQPPSWLPQHRRAKIPEVDVDPLIDELGTDTSTFIAALHENYVPSCSNSNSEEAMESLSGCIDSISDADLLSVDRFATGTRVYSGSAIDGLRQDEMAFQISVRGILFNLPSPVHRSTSTAMNKSDAHRMFYPTSLKTWRKKEELSDLLETLTSRIQGGNLDIKRQQRDERPMTATRGVEHWKTASNTTTARSQNVSEKDAPMEPTQIILGISKTQLLLERLPFMANILGTKKSSGRSPTLDQIESITKVGGQISFQDDETENGNDDHEIAGLEPWATDRPDGDTRKPLPKGPFVQALGIGNGGLPIPVEEQVEALILEDDDIVDD